MVFTNGHTFKQETPMILKLQITTNTKGDVFELVLKKSKYRIGRRFDNDLRIKETYVSAYHAEIHKDKDENYTLIDKNSSNGTFVNGTRVEDSKGVRGVSIREGDYIKFGMLKVKLAPYVDTGPKVVALDERESTTKSISPTQPLTGGKKPPGPPKPSAVSEKTGPFPSSSPLPPTTTSVATVAKGSDENDDLALKLAAVEKERDSFKKEISKKKEEAEKIQKERKSSSENDAREITRITNEFATKEKEFKSEIAKLTKDFDTANNDLAKTKISEESKTNEVIADLQNQITGLEKEQKNAVKESRKVTQEFEKLQSETALLTKREDQERVEKENLHLALKRKSAEAASVATLAAKLEKSEQSASQAGKEQTDKLHDQIAGLESKIEEEIAAREKAENNNQNHKAKLKSAAKEQDSVENNLKQQIKNIESDLINQLAKAEREKAEILKSAEDASAAIENEAKSAKAAEYRIADLEAEFDNEKGKTALLTARVEEKIAALSENEQKLSKQSALTASANELVSKLKFDLEKNEFKAGDKDAGFQKQISELEKSLTEAKADLDAAVSANASKVETADAEIRALKASLTSAEEGLQKAENKLHNSENGKITKLEKELSTLNASALDQQDSYQKLESLFEDTKENLSRDLHEARKEKEEQKAFFQSEENRKLSEAEEALSTAIHARETLAIAQEKLKKKLLSRDKDSGKLQDRIDELESSLLDGQNASGELSRKIESTKGDLSSVIQDHRAEVEEIKAQLTLEKNARAEAEETVKDVREQIKQASRAEKELKLEFQKEITEWGGKFERMRIHKASLGTETEALADIKEAITLAESEKTREQKELEDLHSVMAEMRKENSGLEEEQVKLESKKEKLNSGLKLAKSELENVRKRCRDTRSQEEKFTLRIGAAEKRVQALKHLETELEQAVERQRGAQGGLSRKDVFSSGHAGTPNSSATEEAFCRKLISKLDLLDDLTVRYGNKWRYPKVSEQLTILKGSFLDLLKEHSVDQFHIKPGTVLSLEERKRIKLIPSPDSKNKKVQISSNQNKKENDNDQTRIVNTLRPGYIYQNGGDNVIIRKAEVTVA